MDGIRMNERDLEPEQARPGNPVDELHARRLQLVQRREQVGRLERDVVHPGPASGEEAADGRVVAGRRHELDPALAHEHGRSLDALLVKWLPMLEPRVEEALVRGDGLVEICHREAEMMDATHPRDATRGSGL